MPCTAREARDPSPRPPWPSCASTGSSRGRWAPRWRRPVGSWRPPGASPESGRSTMPLRCRSGTRPQREHARMEPSPGRGRSSTPSTGRRRWIALPLALTLGALTACQVTVGPSGATIAPANGSLRIVVPAGSVVADTVLSYDPVPAVTPAVGGIPGTTFDLAPARGWQEPVEVTLAYDPLDVPFGVAEDDLQLVRFAGGSWTARRRAGSDTARPRGGPLRPRGPHRVARRKGRRAAAGCTPPRDQQGVGHRRDRREEDQPRSTRWRRGHVGGTRTSHPAWVKATPERLRRAPRSTSPR